jgi:hypothetical protein
LVELDAGVRLLVEDGDIEMCVALLASLEAWMVEERGILGE